MLRQYYLDYLRIIAACMVVMIHVSGSFTISASFSKSSASIAGWFGAFVRPAVELFFMISGALLLDAKRLFTRRGYLQRLTRLLIICFGWGFVYALISNWGGELTVYEILKDTWKGPFHFWFFQYMIGVYILIPITRSLVEWRGGRWEVWYILIFFMFGILKTTLNSIPSYNEEIRVITSKVSVEMCDFCGYFVLGHYLSKSNYAHTFPSVFFLILYILVAVIYHILPRIFGFEFLGVDAFSIFVLIESISLFLFFKNRDLQPRYPQVLVRLSKMTLGVYIVHPILFMHVIPVESFAKMNVFVAVPLYFLIICIGSFIISYGLNIIPCVKKWFV